MMMPQVALADDVMRVCYVIDSLEPAGAEVSLLSMLPDLIGLGVDPTVLHFGRGPGLTGRFQDLGVSVEAIETTTRAQRVAGTRRALQRRRPDLVHTTLFEADVAGRLAARSLRLPVASSIVSMQYGRSRAQILGIPPWKLSLARSVDAATAQLVTRFHALTEAAGDHARRHLHVARKPVEVIPRGRSDADLGRRSSARRHRVRSHMGWGEDEVIVLSVARHEPPKGLDVLLDAAAVVARSADCPRFVIAGRAGTATESLLDHRTRLGLGETVSFEGARTDVPDLIAAADLLVVPSRWEGLGSVLIEAMALELPILATRLPPIEEIAPDGTVALLVPPERPDELAAGIRRALSNRQERQDRARRGRRRFEDRYTAERVAASMHGFYERALAAATGRSR